MILLPLSHYHLVREPLAKVDVNVLFAYAVVNQDLLGKIFVDSLDAPTVFYIMHPYGMSLLLGESGHEEFNEALKVYLCNQDASRKKPEWLQVYPRVWESVLERLVSGYLCFEGVDYQKISVMERLNFEFSYEKYSAQKEVIDLGKNAIIQTDETLYSAIKGSVIPSHFWDSYRSFEKSSIGFSLVDEKGYPLSTAFCSFIFNGQLELGIETDSHYSGKGYAYAVCSALIEYCIKQHLVPVWACSSANLGSQKLAEKLGFSIAKKRPYYQLPYTKEPYM